MKIAVYGGAFNPIHLGHEEIIKALNDEYDFDKILIIPSKISPHKSNDYLVSCEARLKMCEISLKEYKKCEVSDIEIRLDGVSYTVNTLTELKKRYTDDELYLVCGSDMFLSLLNWKEPKKIFSMAKILAFIRDNEEKSRLNEYKAKLESCGATVEFCTVKIPPYSSTDIRSSVKENKSIEKFVNKNVAEYIRENNLYKE